MNFLKTLAVGSLVIGATATQSLSAQTWTIWGAGEGGYSMLKTDRGVELDKNGFHLDAKLGVEYELARWQLEGRLGYSYNRMSGSGSGGVMKEKVSTYLPFLELSPRFRLGESFSFGPRLQMGVGKDVKFGPEKKDWTLLWLLGAEGQYRLPTAWPVRLTAAYMTDVSVQARQVHMILGGFQVALMSHECAMCEAADEDARATPKPTAKKAERSLKKGVVADGEAVSLSLGGASMTFEQSSSRVVGRSAEILDELATILNSSPKSWARVAISGHTDKYGARDYNLALSQSRADSVKSYLVSKEVDADSIEAKGFGPDQPLKSADGKVVANNRLHRRVEIQIFTAKKKDKKFMERLEELSKRTAAGFEKR